MEINQQPTQTPPVSQTPPSGQPQDNTQLMSVLAYLSFLVIVPLLTAKENPKVKFHIKQGLVLIIGEVIAYALWAVPFFGWILAPILHIGFVILSIIGIINAINNQEKELPLIGHLGQKFNF